METSERQHSARDAPAPALVCWKVWGGNGQTDGPVSIPGLRGHLYSRPCESHRGGDLYYLSACGSGALARLCLADVTGHGESVSTFSAWMEDVFSRHIHRANPAVVLREVNRRAASRGLEVMSTAVCLSYNSLNGRLAFCNAGHPPIRLCRAGRAQWETLQVVPDNDQALCNVPLAVDGDARFTIGRVRLFPGDRLLVHTDGLTEAQDDAGALLGATLWNGGRLPGAEAPIPVVMEALTSAVAAHQPADVAAEDDITFLILDVLPYQAGNRYSLFLRNNLDRLSYAVKRRLRGGRRR